MNRILGLASAIIAAGAAWGAVEVVDVVVYGGTSAGIAAAVQTVRMGKSVVVVGPDKHLGGLSSGGLGYTDSGKADSIGGIAREFYERIYDHYSSEKSWNWEAESDFVTAKGQGTKSRNNAEKTQWLFEPHAAEQVFETWVRENKITVFRGEYLDRANGVVKEQGRIAKIRMLSGKEFAGKVFIDATYEGDLMAAAGVPYTVGRESNSVYGEKYNGAQFEETVKKQHSFLTKTSAYKVPGDPTSGLLKYVSADPPGKTGEGDKRVQAYCFRLCMTSNEVNRIPFPKPDNYCADDYLLLLREFESGRRDFFRKFDRIPNLKTDTNNHGGMSADMIGCNYDYPDASYERRAEIVKAHEDYQKGLYYFVANDPRVPAEIREIAAKWGLTKDEFKDNGGFSHQIYVREARRMLGAFVMTEHAVLNEREIPRPIGMGSYTLDSHNCQRYVTPDGCAQNEGDVQVGARKGPYRIDYGVITPKKAACVNLLVPVCVSASHIAFGSMRMEPVFMILGQSAATAAVLAIEDNTTVQDVDYAKLARRLKTDKQRF